MHIMRVRVYYYIGAGFKSRTDLIPIRYANGGSSSCLVRSLLKGDLVDGVNLPIITKSGLRAVFLNGDIEGRLQDLRRRRGTNHELDIECRRVEHAREACDIITRISDDAAKRNRGRPVGERLLSADLRFVLVSRQCLPIEGDALQVLGEEAVEGRIEVVERLRLVDGRQAKLDERGEGNDFRSWTESDCRHCCEWIIKCQLLFELLLLLLLKFKFEAKTKPFYTLQELR